MLINIIDFITLKENCKFHNREKYHLSNYAHKCLSLYNRMTR